MGLIVDDGYHLWYWPVAATTCSDPGQYTNEGIVTFGCVDLVPWVDTWSVSVPTLRFLNRSGQKRRHYGPKRANTTTASIPARSSVFGDCAVVCESHKFRSAASVSIRCRRRPELQFLGGKTGLRAAAADGIGLGLASLRSTGSMISTRRYYNEQRKVSLLITFNKDRTLGDETTAALEIDESSTTCSGIEIESPFEDDGKAVY